MKLNGFDQTVGSIVSGLFGNGANFNGGTSAIILTVHSDTSTTSSGNIAHSGAASFGITKIGTGGLHLYCCLNSHTGPTQIPNGLHSRNHTLPGRRRPRTLRHSGPRTRAYPLRIPPAIPPRPSSGIASAPLCNKQRTVRFGQSAVSTPRSPGGASGHDVPAR